MIKTRPLCFVCLCYLIIQAVILIVTSGKSMTDIPASSIFYDEKEKSVFVHGQVYKKTNTSNIQIIYLKNNSKQDSNIMVYDKNFIEIAIGQTIQLKGSTECFDKARNPGNFDQRVYYAKQNIYGIVWCDKVLSVSGEENWILENLYQIKRHWRENIFEAMGEENGAILVAMLLGEKDAMEPEIKELYQKNGIGHILAISGLHISFIGLGIYKLIRKTGLGYGISGILSFLILSLYVFMIGFSVSVIRAYVMLLFRLGADVSGRAYDMVTALMAAAAISIGIQPLFLMDAGFLLSYGAVLGILFVLPVMERMFPCKTRLLSGCYVSVAINVMLFPITLWFYYEFPTYSIILNMVIIPSMSVVLGLGMIGSIIGFVVWPIGKLCLQICGFVLSFFEQLSRMASKFPLSRIVIGQPDLWKILLYYLALLTIAVFVLFFRRKEYPGRLNIGVCVLLCSVIALMIYRPSGSLMITMLDVGQGDGIFIKGPEGNSYLIDGGSSHIEQLGKNRIEPFLKSQGVDELDYVFVTHGDTDHYSGIEEMLGRQEIGVRIRHLVLPANWKSSDALLGLAQNARSQGISVMVMNAGQRLTEGDLILQCIQPMEVEHSLNGNEGSLVLSICFKEFLMLCTGDVEAQGEINLTRKLAGKDYTVLKVAHHGSKHSSSEAFLKTIQPEIALVSAGENNSYGHPHKETMERLQNIGCDIFTTIKNGAITIQTDGNTLTIDRFLY